jgi:hypothetical protein
VPRNLSEAFQFAADTYDIAAILDPFDPECCNDEKSMITYLAEMMKKLPRT